MDNIYQMYPNVNQNNGYLSLYVGPMYSGKTSKLLTLEKQYNVCNTNVCVINYIEDKRYTDENLLSSHDKKTTPCYLLRELNELCDIVNGEVNDLFKNTKVFLINEGQFFKDIVEWVKFAITPPHNKIIHISGLDGDFLGNMFGNWLDLIPYCDHIEKLKAICVNCKEKYAIFTHRCVDNKEQILIGSDCYIPLCRTCYYIKSIK